MFWFNKPTKKRIIMKKPAMVFFAILLIIRAIVAVIISLRVKAIQIVKTNPSSIINIIDNSQTIKSMIWKRWNQLTNIPVKLFDTTFNNLKEIKQYLWFYWEKKYLVILQNSSELRPNGWFYWSFWLIWLSSWVIKSISVEDSYVLPYLNSGVAIQIPERATGIYNKNITFIAWNKFWLTNLDWRNIKMIFESTFLRTTIDGVIFISSDAISAIDSSFSQQLLKRQFINAASDLIGWKSNPYKKEKYLKELSLHFEKNKNQLIKNAILHLNKLQNNWFVNIYLDWASSWLSDLISERWFSTNPSKNILYARDINHAENKIDWFLTKHTQYLRQNWLNDWKDRVTISWDSWVVTLTYSVFIPNWYLWKISEREREFWIKLTEREQYILCVKKPKTKHYWMILLPEWRELLNSSWNFTESPSLHPSPYWTYITYKWGWEWYTQSYLFTFNIRKRIASKP